MRELAPARAVATGFPPSHGYWKLFCVQDNSTMEAAVLPRHSINVARPRHELARLGTRLGIRGYGCTTLRPSRQVSSGGVWKILQLVRGSFVRPDSNVPAGLLVDAGLVVPASTSHVRDAVAALQAGEVIAVPTDTLYGLACDACSPSAVARIYEIKSRSQSKALAVCVADVEDVSRYAITFHLPRGLLEQLLPGPVTLVLPRDEGSLLHPSLNPGGTSIAIRIPQSDFIREVARSFGKALALTSANTSGASNTVCVNEFQQLWRDCAQVFDAGTLTAGRLGSTIVDLTASGVYQIVRTGNALEETEVVLRRFGMKLRNCS